VPYSSTVPLVEVTRGGIVESVHYGAIAVSDGQGSIVWSAGDPDLLSFPRSSLKPLQALALVARGGIDHFGLTSDELAIMAGSHGGEPIHVATVLSVLGKIDAPPEALMCGVQVPLDAAAARGLVASGAPASAVFNNCSGKHAGMLALARLIGAPLAEYIDPEHPAQRVIRDTLVDLLDLDPTQLPIGFDGCSAPAYAVSLRAMARGFALLSAPSKAPSTWQGPLETIASAMRSHPVLVGGSHHRLDTDVLQLQRGLIAKSGAEGYFCIAHPDGLGMALKIQDGDAANRARLLAAVTTVHRQGWLTDHDLATSLSEYGPELPLFNLAGRRVGEVRAAPVFAPSGD
jgi:L-asparaginase II